MSEPAQIMAIARLEIRRVFFSFRSIWVYLLAIFPTILFAMYGLDVAWKRQRYSSAIAPAEVLASIRTGMSEEEVLKRAGRPVSDNIHTRRPRRDEDSENERRSAQTPVRERHMMFFDGTRRHHFHFKDGKLDGSSSRALVSFEDDRKVYAGMFQFFYLRLAIFFGCLGIFINLFRGEMVDKSLHFWLLTPVRREVLLAGKYVAGLIASTAIFGMGAILSYVTLMSIQESADAAAHWQSNGFEHLFWYAYAAVLGCVGYGSVFLASGLLLRNPIIPAVVILLWESVNGFLPVALQKLSVLHYLQSVCPVPAPLPPDVPVAMRLLLSPAAPSPAWAATLGLLALTALVIWCASRVVRKLEINYGTE